jgi:hypothetical protein
VQEANELLPVVKSLMERLLQRIDLLRGRSRLVVRRDELDPDSSDFMQRLQQDEGVARIIKEMNELVDEIHDLGCICKGLEQGLVDFPCFFGDEIVFLCWRYGEESVSHWHRAEEGFAKRKPLLGPGKGGDRGSYH